MKFVLLTKRNIVLKCLKKYIKNELTAIVQLFRVNNEIKTIGIHSNAIVKNCVYIFYTSFAKGILTILDVTKWKIAKILTTDTSIEK